jgi:hypothetical protein
MDGRMICRDIPERTIERYIRELGIMVEGVPQEEISAISSSMEFKAKAADRMVALSWKNPPIKDFFAVKIMRRTDRYPLHPEDGTPVYWYNGMEYVDGNLANGTRYYYGAFVHDKRYHFLPPVYTEALPNGQPIESLQTENPALPQVITEPAVERWGNNDVSIVSLRLLNHKNEVAQTFNTIDGMSIEIEYKINSPQVFRPVFGIGIYRDDGICIYGTNTDLDKVELAIAKDRGKIRFNIERLSLLNGNYWVDIAIHDMQHIPFDYWTKALKFSCQSSTGEPGLYRPDHSWSVHPLNRN